MLCKDHAVFSKVTAGGLCSLPQLWVGEPLARRSEAQAGTGRGLPAIASRSGEAGGGPSPARSRARSDQAGSLGTAEKTS